MKNESESAKEFPIKKLILKKKIRFCIEFKRKRIMRILRLHTRLRSSHVKYINCTCFRLQHPNDKIIILIYFELLLE